VTRVTPGVSWKNCAKLVSGCPAVHAAKARHNPIEQIGFVSQFRRSLTCCRFFSRIAGRPAFTSVNSCPSTVPNESRIWVGIKILENNPMQSIEVVTTNPG
jgi:hypothetical protein